MKKYNLVFDYEKRKISFVNVFNTNSEILSLVVLDVSPSSAEKLKIR